MPDKPEQSIKVDDLELKVEPTLADGPSADTKAPSPSGSGADFVGGDEPESLVDQILAEKYKILAEIGRGGMGIVYKAEHLLLNKILSVKVLHRHLSGETQSLQRFKVEAKAASSLRHENLLAVTDYGVTQSKQPYIVMDFVEGESLAELLGRQGRLSAKEFTEIFSQVLKGLEHAHEKGIIHRDLKPTNIMISKSAEGSPLVRILDFGIAKIVSNEGTAQHLTQTGEIFGSPLYMSPEQCRGGKIDFRSDIYSLGCVMFEALTGAVPVQGPSQVETLYKHLSGDVPTISTAYPQLQIPVDLENIVAKAMNNDPSQRYQNAAQLSQDLATASLSDVSSPRKRTSSTPAKPKSKNPAQKNFVIGDFVLVIVCLAVGSGWFLQQRDSALHKQSSSVANVVKELELADAYGSAAARTYIRSTKNEGAAGQFAFQSKNATEDLAYAKKALEIRLRLSPNSTKLPESYAQVAKSMQELAQSDGPWEKMQSEAEAFYKKAIELSPPVFADANVGKPYYMRRLADLYMNEGKLDQAAKLLEQVSELCRNQLPLYEDYSKYYWCKGMYVEAAKYEILQADPYAQYDELKVPAHPDFTGTWVYASRSQSNEHSFRLKLTAKGPGKLAGDLFAQLKYFQESHNEAYNKDEDHHAVVDVKGGIAEMRYRSWPGVAARCRLIMVGKYLVWNDIESPSLNCAQTAVLIKEK